MRNWQNRRTSDRRARATAPPATLATAIRIDPKAKRASLSGCSAASELLVLRPSDDEESGRTVDRFTLTGTYIDAVYLPVAGSDIACSDDRLFVLVNDDEPMIIGYRVVKAAGASSRR